jgi:hypothetical protein
MRAELKKNLALLACSIMACLLFLELAVRLGGKCDMDGNFIFFGRVLRPFHLPLQATRKNAEDYRHSNRTRIIYDARLGWVPRPNNTSSDGLYAYNSIGARVGTAAPHEYSRTRPAGMLRIVIVGDSYTHGEEVPFASSWGYCLEHRLKEAGIPAEVINLGVGAYGIDQAFLRWRSPGSSLSPGIVILGLQMENVQRSVNLLKPIYQPNTGLPFSKPRFILSGDELRLINIPALPSEELPAILEHPELWDLAPHERFLGLGAYQEKMYLRSRFLALIREIVSPIESDRYFYDLKNEPATLALRILHTFKGEVEQHGSRFLIVQIPTIYDLAILKLGVTPAWTELLAAIGEENTLIHTQDKLLQRTGWTSLSSLFMPGGHYSAKGNELLAEAIAERLISGK